MQLLLPAADSRMDELRSFLVLAGSSVVMLASDALVGAGWYHARW